MIGIKGAWFAHAETLRNGQVKRKAANQAPEIDSPDRQRRTEKPLRKAAEAGREQCPQPQLRDYTVTGKKSIKQDAIAIKSACKKLGIIKTVWYEARNVVLKAFVENDQQERSMHIQGIASS